MSDVPRLLAQASERLRRIGPDRVLIEEDYAVPSRAAREQHNIQPSIVFVRGDLWMLGAPARLEANAHAMWADEWIGFIRQGERNFHPISEYVR